MHSEHREISLESEIRTIDYISGCIVGNYASGSLTLQKHIQIRSEDYFFRIQSYVLTLSETT